MLRRKRRPANPPPPLTPFTTPAGGLAVGMGPRPRRRTWTLAVPRGRQPWMATLQVCAVEACACVRPPARGNHDRSFFFFFCGGSRWLGKRRAGGAGARSVRPGSPSRTLAPAEPPLAAAKKLVMWATRPASARAKTLRAPLVAPQQQTPPSPPWWWSPPREKATAHGRGAMDGCALRRRVRSSTRARAPFFPPTPPALSTGGW